MTDYISREAAVRAAQDGADEWDGGFNRNRDAYIERAISEVPAADVRPVVRETWEIADSYAGPGLINLRCSVCGAFGGTWKDNTIPSMLPKFCHECGADMRK